MLRRIDAYQRRHPWLAFPVAVQKKFGDDEGGNLCAMLTYYGFLSLFPLLLVFFTVLGFVLDGNPSLQHDIRTSALANIPIIGDQIATERHVGAGERCRARGRSARHALGWTRHRQRVPGRDEPGVGRAAAARPGFVPRVLRDLALLGTLGVAIVATTVLGAAAGFVSGNIGWRVLATLLAVALDTAVFLLRLPPAHRA